MKNVCWTISFHIMRFDGTKYQYIRVFFFPFLLQVIANKFRSYDFIVAFFLKSDFLWWAYLLCFELNQNKIKTKLKQNKSLWYDYKQCNVFIYDLIRLIIYKSVVFYHSLYDLKSPECLGNRFSFCALSRRIEYGLEFRRKAM